MPQLTSPPRTERPVTPTVPPAPEGAFPPWLATAGGTAGSGRYAAAAVARVRLHYDEEKADLVADEEYEAVLHPLTSNADPAVAVAVDYDDRDLLTSPAGPVSFVLPDAPVNAKTFWSTLERSRRA